ncbi:MAG: hypothetical protein JO132_01420 [Streptosporangiaceae bacterium]|nr:hypothetical protein [Streptosporangiaceae bacterium]
MFGAASVLEERSTKQAGPLIAPVLAVITTADPLVSMAAGAAFLHEKIAAAPVDLAAEGLFLAMAIGGIIALAQRAPQAAKDHAADAGLPALARTRVSLMASGACAARTG